MMRTIRKIHASENRPVADLKTVSPLPSHSIEMLDPFLFLNHHGPQVYKPGNNGLPFGPHPHRGIETVTVILDGDILHKDSEGHESVISSGGVQWMTAGKGLMHSETSSDHFKQKGGKLEILQLWINLPAKLKMTEPKYSGKNENEIPFMILNEEKVKVNLIAGSFCKNQPAFETLTKVHLNTIEMKSGGEFFLRVPPENTIFFYLIKGKVNVNGTIASQTNLVEFNNDEDEIYLYAESDALILFGHAKPFNEPVAFGGPFVMNTEEEIHQAYEDYQNGKFGIM